jgi:Protein kinase domain
MTVECPSQQLLRRYAIGDLDDDASDDVERHLALCPACEDSLAQCDSAEDSLMRHLPLAGALSVEMPAESPGWLAQLRNGPLDSAAPAPAVSPDAAGPAAEFSSYELLGVLGHGGMGVVYRARHRQLGRLVALKVLSPRLMATAEARRRFEREIRVLGGLHHPGIVMATDANRIDGAAYLVMELIDGVDMARMVRDGGPLTVAEACEAGRQIADALAAAHLAGTIHRDMKPSNVMIDRTGRAKLLDFGLAHLAELSTESRETSLGRLLGTLDYMAPEQADSERALDPRVDLFGLGATLFYLLTGRPPHGDHSKGSLLAQLRALVAEEPPRVSTLRADVPPELDEFIARLLSRDPAQRPESAESVSRTLSTWAGGNLAARVDELCRTRDSEAKRPTNSTEEEAAPSSGAIAQRSLSELLRAGLVSIPEERPLPAAPQLEPKPPRRGTGRKIAVWTAAAALIGAVLFGVMILLKTPEGTLQINSDVSNVSVELVNEQNQSRTLQIERGENATTLRAGAYRVRFAGAHDGIAIEPDRITLKRGEQTVARITRLPSSEKVPPAQTAKTAPESKSEDPFAAGTKGPLYQGLSEQEWQRMFLAETSPSAKLDQAVALVTLAAELPPKERIQKILDVGTEIVHASFGDDVIDFALSDPTKPPTAAPRWQIKKSAERYISLPDARFNRRGGRVAVPRDSENREDVYSAYSHFQDLVNHDLQNIPDLPLAEALSAAMWRGPSTRAAFAASLLRVPARSTIEKNEAAAQVVLRAHGTAWWQEPDTDPPPPASESPGFPGFRRRSASLAGVDWAAVCLLVRVGYVDTASDDQVQRIAAAINQLRDQLQASPSTNTAELLRADLLDALKVEPKAGWPASVRQTMASLLLDGIVSEPDSSYGTTHLDFFLTKKNSNAEEVRIIYDPQYVSKLREKSRQFLDQWLGVANGFLQKHAEPPYDAAVRAVAESVSPALLVYSDGDNWPVDETIALFTKQLRTYYADNPNERTVQSANDLLPASPALLLTQIVRVTGDIPDFVKKGHPKPRSVIAKWERFEVAVNPQMRGSDFHRLFEDDPYAVMQLAVRPPAAAEKIQAQGFVVGPLSPEQIISATANYDVVDPILVLSLLADLTGNSPAQDVRIAAFLKTWQPGTNMGRGLENLFASHLRAREQARRLLQRMMTKAKSPSLMNAVRELNLPLSPQSASDARPSLGVSQATPTSAAAKEPSASPSSASESPVYQGVSAEEWQRKFAHETSPVAKLDDAVAMVTLAAELSPKDHLAKVLDVGAEIVRASFGDEVIDFALDASKTFPTHTPRWQIKLGENSSADDTPRDVPYATFRRFLDLVNQDIRTIPAGVLAEELSAAARSGPSTRGAFAASLLRGAAKAVIAENPEASKVVSRQLDIPLKGLDWTALCLILRAAYVQNDSAAQIQSLAPAIVELGDRLRVAAVSPTTNWMKQDLVGVLKSEPQGGWPPRVPKTIAQLILDSIVREHRPFDWLVSVPYVPWTQTYAPKVVAERRHDVGRLFGQSLAVANEYLKQHTAPPYDFADCQVVEWTELPLILYSDGDSWPAAETAALLTQQLRAYYSEDPRGTSDQSPRFLSAFPSKLLTDIVRVTGEIPDFVKSGYPRLRTVAATRQRVEQALKSRDIGFMRQNLRVQSPASQINLAVFDPYGAIKLSVELASAKEPPNQEEKFPFQFNQWFSPQTILRLTVRESSDIDPLFYLAVLTDLAGRNPTWDDNIALLVKNWKPGSDTRVGLEYLIAGHTKASDHARRLLKTFAAKAKSPKLADAIRELNAALRLEAK